MTTGREAAGKDSFGEPVERLPGEERDEPRDVIGLCLSGGGYRAMLYHAGTLLRLHELGVLPRVARVSSVSGGSIAAGVLALAWNDLRPGRASFLEKVVAPLRRLADHTLDVPSVLGALGDGGVGDHVAREYRRHLFGNATLQDLPDAPRFIFNATSVQTKSLVRFSKREVADWRVGRILAPQVELATAVAASSAFPPFLSPLTLRLDPAQWAPPDRFGPAELRRPEFMQRLVLTDGGVYDNLGLETVWKDCDHVLVSDGGGLWAPEADPKTDWPRHFYRVFTLVDNQVRALRKGQVIAAVSARNAGRKWGRWGAYWSIWIPMREQAGATGLPCRPEATLSLARTPTRLAALDPDVQARLVNWGYASCDASIRKHYKAPTFDPTAGPAPTFPFPEAGVEPVDLVRVPGL